MGFITYIKETRAEFKHVNWPTRRQAILSTVLVIVVTVAVAYFLGLFDAIFARLLERFIIS